MKKISFIILVIVILFGSFCLVSCSSTNNLIDDVEKIEKITITNKTTNEVVEITDATEINNLGNDLRATVQSKDFQEKWNSMGSKITYTYNYSILINMKKSLFKKAYSYSITIGRIPDSGKPSDEDKTFARRDTKYGSVSLSTIDYLNKLFI
ncbi:MAG: hypothetical protein WCR54_05005 [Clostridia bacterium]